MQDRGHAWYLVQTKPHQEILAEQSLRALGLETFLPRLRQQRVVRRRRQSVTGPLFPGYVFARFDYERYARAVNYARGARHLVMFGDVPALVTPDIVEAIVARMENGAVVVRPTYRAGDRVRIGCGPLEGLDAVFEREMPDHERVVLLLRSLSYQARIVVDLAEVVNL